MRTLGGMKALDRRELRFVRDDVEPVYLATWREGGFAEKVDRAHDELRACTVCPRDCGNDRMADEVALCHTGRHARVASAFARLASAATRAAW